MRRNAFGTAYGILQGFCNFLQTVFPVLMGQVIDTAPTKMSGFRKAAECLLMLVGVSLSLTLMLIGKKYSSLTGYQEDKEEDMVELATIRHGVVISPRN